MWISLMSRNTSLKEVRINHEDPRASNVAQDSTTTAAISAAPVPRLIFRPPRIAVALLVGAALIDGWLDWPRLFNWPWRGVGALAVLGGLALTLWTLRLFHDADTTHHPYGRPATFIRSGPYRFTRNPMYLGVTIFLLGVGVLVGTPALMFCWLAFAWIIDVRFIPREERALEKQFDDEYEEYRSQVRRWL